MSTYHNMVSSIPIQYLYFPKRSIWSIDKTLTGIFTPDKSQPGSNGKKGVTPHSPNLLNSIWGGRCCLEWAFHPWNWIDLFLHHSTIIRGNRSWTLGWSSVSLCANALSERHESISFFPLAMGKLCVRLDSLALVRQLI